LFTKSRFFECCLPCRANDAACGNDAASLMMCTCGTCGKHRIIDRAAIASFRSAAEKHHQPPEAATSLTACHFYFILISIII